MSTAWAACQPMTATRSTAESARPAAGPLAPWGFNSGDRAFDPGLRAATAVPEDSYQSPTAVRRPGHHKNNEHFTELLGTPTRLVLLLLHDFPEPGNFPSMGVQVSDTLNPHERPFTGMLGRYPRSASGRGGCSFPLPLGSPPFPVLARVSFSGGRADGDRRRVVTAGAQGLAGRFVGEDGAVGAQPGRSAWPRRRGRSAERVRRLSARVSRYHR